MLEVIHSPECFYVDAHQRIFETIKSLASKGGAIDLLTITEELRRSGDLELIGGAYYLTQLTMSIVSSAHVIAHSRIVMEKYMHREIIRLCGTAMSNAYEGTEDIFELMEELEKGVYELSQRNAGNELMSMSKDVVEITEEINFKRENKITFTGVPTGFPYLDDLTGGWQKSDLIILAARPSVGKTAFALNLAYNAATSPIKKTAVAVFSLEMGRGQLVKRLMSRVSGVPFKKIKNPVTLEMVEVEGVYRLSGELGDVQIYIDDTPGITVAQVKAKCRRLKKKLTKRTDIDDFMIIIDYMQLMGSGNNYKGNREQEISSISRELKAVAKELDVPVLALSQLSRGVEGRADKKPVLSDLRESGAIEQDADMVMLMYKPLKAEIEKIPALEFANYLDIAKHRNGELDAMPLYKNLSIQKFSDQVLIDPFANWAPKQETKLKPMAEVLEELAPNDPTAPDDLPF